MAISRGQMSKQISKGGSKVPKDACYKKVKARYKVFPSAYASGAIAKCRKVGAKNWGNSSKKRKRSVTKKLVDGGFIAMGCGDVQENRRKETRIF
tara:strand:+ start:489 stop:773 length:285 start_codon:yes stop_codon:yes gene_type:complete